MIWLAVRQFIGANWLLVGLASAAVVAVVGWDSSRKASWVERGKEQVRVQIEKNTDANAKKADAARRDAERLPASRLCDRYARDC